MSKHKKRHSNSTYAAKKRAEDAIIADQKDRARKRMDPMARTLLLFDLVYLSIIALLDRGGYLSQSVENVTTFIGAIILVAALYFLLRPKNSNSPRLK